MKKTILQLSVFWAAGLSSLFGQTESDITVILKRTDTPIIAITDMRGSGEAQQQMGVFNQTLYNEVASAGVLRIAAKSMYPLSVPQQPQDFAPGKSQLADWSKPPVEASYLAFGYTAIQNGQLVLFGWLYDVRRDTPQAAQVIGKLYFGEPSAVGATKVAQDFAADILALFGAKTLAGTKIYFVSDRTGTKEIWSMDYDGRNQTQLTRFGAPTISFMLSVSKDNRWLAFTQLSQANPAVKVLSLETKRTVPFFNPPASVNASPDFTPDGQHIVFSSSFNKSHANIYIAELSGKGLNALTSFRAVETEPKVNPKTGREIVMTSGRSGPPQIYKMSIDGTDVERLTSGEGDAVNPSWHPDGQLIAFAWTRGFEPGNFNIFVMDVVKRTYAQLTHGVGRNENPTWAPDGRHLVFCSNRDGSSQIYTMLADGTQVKKLTGSGRNTMPVWSK